MAKPAKPAKPPARKRGQNIDAVPLGLLMEYAAQGLNDAEIARVVGRNKATVNERLREFRQAAGNLKTYKSARADIFAVLGRELLYSLTPSDIKGMPPASRVTCAAILYDKERLERGQSTEIVTLEHIDNDISAIDAEIIELETRLKRHGRLKAVSNGGGVSSECPRLPVPDGASYE